MKKLVILDRDGVINVDLYDYVKHPDEFEFIPESTTAMAKLTQAGYQIAIATNQAGIAAGLYSTEDLEKIHDKMIRMCRDSGAGIDLIRFCPHEAQAHCSCRKPAPGLLIEIAKHFDMDTKDIIFVGDKFSDIQAAQNAGCKPILVLTGYGKAHLSQYQSFLQDVPVYENLAAYVEALLVSTAPVR